MIFQILAAASMKFRDVWDVSPCNHVKVDRRFRGAYCLHHQGKEAVRTSETSVNFNVTTRRYIPEDSKLQIQYKSRIYTAALLNNFMINSLKHSLCKFSSYLKENATYLRKYSRCLMLLREVIVVYSENELYKLQIYTLVGKIHLFNIKVSSM
jgi:hypothetical protein